MNDVRAEVLCSLGPVSSANVSDDYLQGSGVIKTRGSVELKGIFVPAVGTTVTFSWNKPSGTTDLPRELRVLSSTVDPFRLVTRVELGCALTYFANRKPPTENPNSKNENSSIPCYVYNFATLPISASYVLEQCATALGLTLSSNPLTSKFSLEEFDLSQGYVQVMGDLLVSEGYFGMVRSGTLLEVFNLQSAGMTGPTITADDIIDLGPVGVGTLPGETARVKYTTRRLKAPEDLTDDEASSRNWESEKTIGDRTETSYTYTDEAGDQVTVIGSYVPYSVTYSFYDGWDRLIFSTTRELTVSTEVNGRWSADTRSIVPVERRTHQYNYYKVGAPLLAAGYTPEQIAALATASDLDVEAVQTLIRNGDIGPASECIVSKPDGYSDIRQTVTDAFASELAIVGSLNVDTYKADDGNVVSFDTVANYHESRTVVTYDKDPSSGITRTKTQNYKLASQTITGQQDLATYTKDGLDTATSTSLDSSITGLLAIGARMRLVGAETRIRTEREFGLQRRPSQAERNNSSNAKAEPVEATEETVWAVGSVETEATQEFSLPYAPDDVIGWTELGGYTSTPSDAKEKALAFGRIQNRLLLGNRYALSLQLDPGILPDAPFKPLYVQAAGITGQYRANGCSWAMTKDGVIASTDALYWGAVGADPGSTAWLPLPPGMDAADLPATPVTPSVVIPPFNETVIKAMAVRVSAEVTRFGYALQTLTEAAPRVRARMVTSRPIIGSAGSFTVSGVAAGLVKVRSMVVATGAFSITGNAATTNVSRILTGAVGTFAITGNSAALLAKGLIASTGTFTITGVAATLTKSASPAVWTTGVSNITYSNSNRTATASSTSEKTVLTTTGKSTGKWYLELSYYTTSSSNANDEFFGVAANNSNYPGGGGGGGAGIAGGRSVFNQITGATTSGSMGSITGGTNVYMIALDLDNKKLWFGLNGTWISSGNPAAGTNPNAYSWSGTPTLYGATRIYYNTEAATIVTSQAYLPSGFTAWDS